MSYMKPFLVASLAFLSVIGIDRVREGYESPGSLNSETSKQVGELQDSFEAIFKPMMIKAIREQSLKLGIQNLRDAEVNANTETRVWVGFGIAITECFILVNSDQGHKAFYFAPKVVDNRVAEDRNGNAVMQKTVLKQPKSGWPEFIGFLSSRGIDSALKLSPLKKHRDSAYEDYIVIELKSGQSYNFVYYPRTVGDGDRQKALEVCQRIEQDFDIGLGCSGIH